MPWLGAYTASDKRPAVEKGPVIRDQILCAHIYTAENLEFLDTPVHIHIHVVTMHEYKTIMVVLIVNLQQITALPV